MAGNAPKGYIGAANEPVYGPQGSPDEGLIIGYKKVNPGDKNVTPYGESDFLLRLYARLAQREEIKHIHGVEKSNQI
jgi:hypothetical protein